MDWVSSNILITRILDHSSPVKELTPVQDSGFTQEKLDRRGWLQLESAHKFRWLWNKRGSGFIRMWRNPQVCVRGWLELFENRLFSCMCDPRGLGYDYSWSYIRRFCRCRAACSLYSWIFGIQRGLVLQTPFLVFSPFLAFSNLCWSDTDSWVRYHENFTNFCATGN